MADTANDRIQDEYLERAIYLERYKRGVATRVLALLARLEEDLAARMAALDPNGVATRYRQARLTRLLAEVQERIDAYGEALEREVMPDLEQLARDEGKFGVKLLGEVPPVALDVIAPSAKLLEAAAMSRPFQGRILKEWVREHPAGVRMRTRQMIRQGVAEGQTIAQMTQKLRGTRANGYRDGIMEVNRRAAEAMVRTAVNHTVTAARERTYADNADIIKGVKWVSTLDGRTSEVCAARDGTVYPMDKGPRPPAHPNCRSTTVPVLKSWKELGIPLGEAPEGTRASMDGQVAASTTYSDWLRKRPAAFQEEVLGKAKAQLFREGGLGLDKFVDASGRSYTLDELRKRVPEAFERAGL